jgi:hypothetical protein
MITDPDSRSGLFICGLLTGPDSTPGFFMDDAEFRRLGYRET